MNFSESLCFSLLSPFSVFLLCFTSTMKNYGNLNFAIFKDEVFLENLLENVLMGN